SRARLRGAVRRRHRERGRRRVARDRQRGACRSQHECSPRRAAGSRAAARRAGRASCPRTREHAARRGAEASSAMSRGFTLIELAVTAAIVSILALAVLPLAETAARRARESELRVALRELRQSIDAYKKAWDDGRIERKADETGYPPTLELLVQGV